MRARAIGVDLGGTKILAGIVEANAIRDGIGRRIGAGVVTVVDMFDAGRGILGGFFAAAGRPA